MTTTPKNSLRSIENLFGAISSSVKEIGIQNTIHLLEKGQAQNIWKSDLSLAAQAICSAFDISTIILFGKSRKYPRKYAFACWVWLCYYDLNYSIIDLQGYAKTSTSTISKAKQFIDNFGNDTTFEKKIHQKLDQAKIKLKELLNR
jgi:hypothetical protein